MGTKLTLAEHLCDIGYEDTKLIPGFDDAYCGMTTDDRAVYNYAKMVQILVCQGMDGEEAVDYLSYNTIRALDYEDKAPVIIYPDSFVLDNE